MKKSIRRALAAGLAALVCAASAPAQPYPSKPVRLVIPYPPGGVDVMIRLIMPVIDREIGGTTVIDYRPGASGLIGTEYVSRAEPDGYTLLATASNPWVVTPAMRKETPYHPVKSFTPISTVTQGGVNIIIANNDFPANNVREMIDYAKKYPDKVAVATSGIGSFWHLDAEYMNYLAGTKILHAPFAGFAPMLPAIISGQVQLGLITYQIAAKLVAAKKIKIIGILTTDPRADPLIPPGIQRVKEVLPEYESGPSWIGIGGPAGLPRPIVTRLNAAIVKATNTPEMEARTRQDRIIISGSTPEEFAERIRRDFELAQKIVKLAGIKPLE